MKSSKPARAARVSPRAFVANSGHRHIARSFVYDLATQTTGWGVTTLLVGEYAAEELSKYAEFAIADGILRLGAEKQELTSVREIDLLNLRGMDYLSAIHFLEISDKGVFVFPRVRA